MYVRMYMYVYLHVYVYKRLLGVALVGGLIVLQLLDRLLRRHRVAHLQKP